MRPQGAPPGCAPTVRPQGAPPGCAPTVRPQGAPPRCALRVRPPGAPPGCAIRVRPQGAPSGCAPRVRPQGAHSGSKFSPRFACFLSRKKTQMGQIKIASFFTQDSCFVFPKKLGPCSHGKNATPTFFGDSRCKWNSAARRGRTFFCAKARRSSACVVAFCIQFLRRFCTRPKKVCNQKQKVAAFLLKSSKKLRAFFEFQN